MDPDPLRLLETAHPLRSGSISQGSPKPRFAIRPNCRLKRPSKLVNKTVNNFIKFVDGPTQMSRRRRPRSRPFPSGTSETPAACSSLLLLSYVQPCNRPQSVIDHEDDDDDEDDYKDQED